MTSPTLPQIVEGMTKAQRRYVRDASPIYGLGAFQACPPPSTHAVLERLGLVSWNGCLTETGKQVRTHLLSLGEGV